MANLEEIITAMQNGELTKLSFVDWDDAERIAILNKVRNCPRVTELDFSVLGSLSEPLVEVLSRTLLASEHIQKLDFTGCNLSQSQLSPLLLAAFRVKHVELRNNLLSDDCVPFLASFIESNRNLLYLGLENNFFGQSHSRAVRELMKNWQPGAMLSLGGNRHLSRHRLVQMFKAIPKSGAPFALFIRNLKYTIKETAACIQALGEALESNRSTYALDLDGGTIGEASIMPLANLMMVRPDFQLLRVSNNTINGPGIDSLIKAFANGSKLQHLYIQKTALDFVKTNYIKLFTKFALVLVGNRSLVTFEYDEELIQRDDRINELLALIIARNRLNAKLPVEGTPDISRIQGLVNQLRTAYPLVMDYEPELLMPSQYLPANLAEEEQAEQVMFALQARQCAEGASDTSDDETCSLQ